VALLLLMALGMGFLRTRRRRGKAAMILKQGALAAGEGEGLEAVGDAGKQLEARLSEQIVQKQKLEAEALNALRLPQVTTKKSEVLTRHIGDAARKDPTLMVHVLRSWLEEDK
jgi:flagellar biosynthesis/type III secretory pathway M-ring protein FliF/YscJ